MQLLDLHLGRPVVRGALTLFPVWNSAAVAARGYDLRTPALAVDERAGTPVVNELVVTNSGARPALVLEGELLEGGQQHRIAARTVLVAQQASEVLAVRCVEQGRWAGTLRHQRRGRRAPLRVRARSAEGQSRVWSEVARYEQQHGASPTSSLLDATAAVEKDAAQLVADLTPLPFQTGVLIGIAGQPLLLEVFDSPRTLRHAWIALLHGAAVDAVGQPAVATPGHRARRFLDRLRAVRADEAHDAGLGIELRGQSTYARLSATTWQGRVVHGVAINPRHALVAA